MTTITKEFTKEQLIAKAREQIAFCRDTKITGEGRTHVNQCSSLFEIALAALTAEPVAWTDAEELRDLRTVGFCEMFTVEPVSKDADMYRVIPLYTAPPVPVSVPDGLKQAVEFYEQVKQENIPVETGAWKDAVNWVLDEACRAAMLQDNQRDLSQPVDPQVAEYEQIMLQAGNSPVSPGGWISCSERMPDSKTAVLVAREFDRKGDWRMKWATYIPGHPDANDGWIIPGASWKPSHWMPLPEPPQE
ncbi:TPA: DUF551 domain-containing protein [Salmonella enterica]